MMSKKKVISKILVQNIMSKYGFSSWRSLNDLTFVHIDNNLADIKLIFVSMLLLICMSKCNKITAVPQHTT